jgi:hypothetical protein
MSTYIDFKLGDDNDLAVEKGDLVEAYDQEVIAGQVKINLQSFKKDWFLNFDQYITYFDNDEGLLGSKSLSALNETEIRVAILAVDGVLNINNLNVVLENSTMKIDVEIETIFGSIEVDATI